MTWRIPPEEGRPKRSTSTDAPEGVGPVLLMALLPTVLAVAVGAIVSLDHGPGWAVMGFALTVWLLTYMVLAVGRALRD